jgi:hypothetical protein
MNLSRQILTVLALGLSATAVARERSPVLSLQSLLEEMTDRDAVAKWPVPAYTCRQASSWDRAQKTPTDPAGWHANKDYEQFIRTEENAGRREWVIMEHAGPGAITRFWLPLSAKKDKQVIRFYFDGSPTPAIECNFNELLSGRGFVRPPLAFVAWNETDLHSQMKAAPATLRQVGGDLYLPIPFAKSCKITLDELPFYYIVNYRAYALGTTVATFTMADFEKSAATLNRTGEALTADLDLKLTGQTKQAVLAPGKELSLKLPGKPTAVRNLQVQIDPKDAPQVLRSVVLSATFDGEETVWCPVGEFFGTGARLNPVHDWFRSVGKDGTLAARWVMPYRRAAQVTLKNLGTNSVAVTLAATTDNWKWDDQSLHFHATWRGQQAIKTQPRSDWNYVEINGRGRYVGDTLTVFSPDKAWYGEGDERVYVDGEKFPSHLGTGTEDYYGYAWGMATYFSSPFIAMPHRDTSNRSNWKGYTTTSRVRLLDDIPFTTAFKLDMEIWHWANTKVDYAVGCFWYARPDATSNRAPTPEEARRSLSEIPGTTQQAGAIECETMTVAAKSPGLRITHQDSMLPWSGNEQLFIQATKVGDFVELDIPVTDDKSHRVVLHGTKSYDYGILRFSINGQPAGSDYDAFNAAAIVGEPIELGRFEPKNGKLVLRVEVVGANPASRGPRYYFGLDCVVLQNPTSNK